MAIYGIGAFQDGHRQVLDDFIQNGIAATNQPASAVVVHEFLDRIQTGDLIYAKSFNPTKGLTIKAIGIVTDGTLIYDPNVGKGIRVKWVWHGENVIGHLNDNYPIRTCTIYEELNPELKKLIASHF